MGLEARLDDGGRQTGEENVAATRSSRRSGWIDAARGIGIILVVFAHSEHGIKMAGMPLPMPATDFIHEAIYAFHMPLFFLLAGWHVPRGLAAGRTPFLRDKLATIVWPYFLWAAIYIAINMAVKSVNEPLGAKDLIALPWRPVAHFWFLYALFLCNLLAAAIWRGRGRGPLLAAAIALPVAAFGWGTTNIALQMALFFPFFALGMALGQSPIARDAPLYRLAPVLLIAGFTALALNRMMTAAPPLAQPGAALLYYFGALGGIAGVVGLSLLVGERSRWLRRIGQASMAIYVLHIFVSAGMRIVAVHFGLPVDPIVLLLVSSLAAVVFPWLVYEVIGRRGLTVAFGLGKFVRG